MLDSVRQIWSLGKNERLSKVCVGDRGTKHVDYKWLLRQGFRTLNFRIIKSVISKCSNFKLRKIAWIDTEVVSPL